MPSVIIVMDGLTHLLQRAARRQMQAGDRFVQIQGNFPRGGSLYTGAGNCLTRQPVQQGAFAYAGSTKESGHQGAVNLTGKQ